MNHVEAIRFYSAVAAIHGIAVVGLEAVEILAPIPYRRVLEALLGREVADGPELAFLLADRRHLDHAVTLPVPASELIADHVEALRESHGADGDGKGLGVEHDLVVTGGGNSDVVARLHSRELDADLRREAFGDTVGVGFLPGVVITDLEPSGDVHYRAGPDITVLSHHEVLAPRASADLADEGESGLVLFDEYGLGGIVVGDVVDSLCPHLDVLVTGGERLAKLRLEHAVGIGRIDGACGVLLRSSYRHRPIVVGADLELVACGESHATGDPDVTLGVGHVYVRRPTVPVDGADE